MEDFYYVTKSKILKLIYRGILAYIFSVIFLLIKIFLALAFKLYFQLVSNTLWFNDRIILLMIWYKIMYILIYFMMYITLHILHIYTYYTSLLFCKYTFRWYFILSAPLLTVLRLFRFWRRKKNSQDRLYFDHGRPNDVA